MPAFETERLILRRWDTPDFETFAALNADPRVMEFMPELLSREQSDAQAQAICDDFKTNDFGRWAVEVKHTGRFIGFTGLSPVKFKAPFAPAVEIAWRLAHEAWGNGYATEAAQAAVEQGFTFYGLKEIVSFTVPDNLKSRRVMEKLGMSRDPAEDFDHPALPEGHKLRKHVLYRLAKD